MVKKVVSVLGFLSLSFSVHAATWTQPYIDGLVQHRRLRPLIPERTITRSEYAVLLEQTFLVLPQIRRSPQFRDLRPSHWAHRPLVNAVEGGFLAGSGPDIFPDRPLTRLEAMVSLANGLQLPVNPRIDRRQFLSSKFNDSVPAFAVDAVSALVKQNVWLTTPSAPVSLDLNRPITQGELAVLVYEVLAAQRQVPPLPRAPIASVTRLEVSLSRRRVTAFKGNTKFRTYPIAVGREGWETPTGSFRVQQLVPSPDWQNPFTGQIIRAGDPDNPLGHYWIGFWTDGRIWSGFHGTPKPRSVGQAVSHGCLRMFNEDIKELFALVSTTTIVNVRN